MKYLALFVFGMALLGCNSSKNANGEDTFGNTSDTLNSAVISFEQTACYGTCPVHKLIIYSNGEAVYVASRHTELIGTFTSQFTKSEIQEIFSKANELNFYAAENEYTAPMTDLPTSILFVNDGAKSKSVSAYGEYPDSITSFINYFTQIIDSKKWVKVE